jgi:hypothetical protein
MKKYRLSSLALLSIECDLLREIESTDIIETFDSLKSGKVSLYF